MHSPHLQEWIRSGRASPITRELSAQFARYLDTLPWYPSKLNWSKMPASLKLNVSEAKSEDIAAWARRTRLGRHSHLVVYYSEEVGGLVLPFEDAVVHLDELYWMSPGVRFAFGADFENGAIKPAFDSLLQYGDGDWLFATAG